MKVKGLHPRWLTAVATLGLVLLSAVVYAAVQPEAPGYDFPRDVSLDGWRIDWLIEITMVFVLLLFVIMCIWIAIAYIWHDEKATALYDHGDSKHHVTLALVLSALIFFVVDGNLFVNSVIDLDEAFWNFEKAESDPDAVRIEINARQWAWQARYAGPDGEFDTPDDITTLNEIPVPVDVPVIMHLAAVDVIHAIYLPNLRQKIDAVPGSLNPIWFQATETGDFDIGCAQHCGTHHYKMRGILRILSKADFAAWHEQAAVNAARAYDPDDTDAHWGWPWRKDFNW